MNAWRLAIWMGWRDARAGALWVLMLAVTLAVAAQSSVGLFASRIDAGFTRDARAMLGGDVVLRSSMPLDASTLQQARAQGLTAASQAVFPTMARASDAQGGQMRLVALKAVQDTYPLFGSLTIAKQRNGQRMDVTSGPPAGQAWAEAGVFDALALNVGDRVWVGEKELVLSAVLLREPDKGNNFVNFSPRLLMAQADLSATGLVQAASRVQWRTALTGNAAQVKALTAQWQQRAKAEPELGWRIESLNDDQPAANQTLGRAQSFLGLVAMLTVILSAVALAVAARTFAQHRVDACAMLRVLGVRQRTMAWAFAFEFAVAGVLASALGLLVGAGVQALFAHLLSGLLDVQLPAPGLKPLWQGMALGTVLVLCFGLPSVLQLAQVPALRVIRRDVGPVRWSALGVWVMGGVALSVLLLLTAGNLTLGLTVLVALAVALVVFAATATLLVRGLSRWSRRPGSAVATRLAVRQWVARSGLTVAQVVSLALGLFTLALLTLIRSDLVDSWRAATPVQAANRFVINLQPEQMTAFKARLQSVGITDVDAVPMYRGRWTELNGQVVDPQSFDSERAQRLADRDFNLSFSAELPARNTLVEGAWQPQQAGMGVSVEEGFAQTMGLRMGDRMRFDLAGLPLEATVTSLRKVDWASLRVNFFAIVTQAPDAELPHTYIASYRVPDALLSTLDRELVQAFPNLTVIDTVQTLIEVERILDQVIAAVEILFVFALVAGLAVLLATLYATLGQREHEMSIYRALGAQRALLMRMQSVELVGLGALAGLLGGVAAMLTASVLAASVFDFVWMPNVWLLPTFVGLGAGLSWATGAWMLRRVVQTPAWVKLRQLDL